jgi:hypothetical protein
MTPPRPEKNILGKVWEGCQVVEGYIEGHMRVSRPRPGMPGAFQFFSEIEMKFSTLARTNFIGDFSRWKGILESFPPRENRDEIFHSGPNKFHW